STPLHCVFAQHYSNSNLILAKESNDAVFNYIDEKAEITLSKMPQAEAHQILLDSLRNRLHRHGHRYFPK
ncbi:hypothetical protein OH460_27255, partial [Vibrio sp. Makdt]|uniref:hypothetical protein n=1 Tax=Vibrio sp. Makdt TaxID=2998828 RepID=UPI0022CD3237